MRPAPPSSGHPGARAGDPSARGRTAALLAEPGVRFRVVPAAPSAGRPAVRMRHSSRRPAGGRNPSAAPVFRVFIVQQRRGKVLGVLGQGVSLKLSAVRTESLRKGRLRVSGRLGIGSQKYEVVPNGAWALHEKGREGKLERKVSRASRMKALRLNSSPLKS